MPSRAEGYAPVVAGMHPDPSVCRVGDDYYLACSSFELFPGVPILHSRDLREWTQLGNALDRPAQLPLAGARASDGVYAPTLRHHDGLFRLVTTVVNLPGQRIYTASDPAGPWSDAVVVDVPGIDPDLAWDESGTCYLTWSDNYGPGGPHGILQARIDLSTGELQSDPVGLWSGSGLRDPEAPHLYRVGRWWYLLLAEGGTGAGHAISVARGPAPDGPYEPCPHNPVLSHRSLDHPVQNTGHGDLVEAPDGSWWMVLLGVRPRGAFPLVHVLGRETFLARVRWCDGWPVPVLEPHGVDAPARILDDFDAAALEPGWVSPRERPDAAWSLAERPGWLTLHGPPEFLLARRQQHHDCRVRARIDPRGVGDAGLRLRLDDDHHYDVRVRGHDVTAVARIGPAVATFPGGSALGDPLLGGAGDVVLEIATRGDRVTLSVEVDGALTLLADLDGRPLSTEAAGGFTGRVVGPYVRDGTLHVDWVEYIGGPDG